MSLQVGLQVPSLLVRFLTAFERTSFLSLEDTNLCEEIIKFENVPQTYQKYSESPYQHHSHLPVLGRALS